MTKDDDLHDLPDHGTGNNTAGTEERAPRTPLAGIGAALRRLRMHRGLRQYEAAEAAGITKAMLSAYETGKRRPSLKTLDSLLRSMGAHLGDLHLAMMEERRGYRRPRADGTGWREGGRSLEVREPAASEWPATDTQRPDVYALLGIEGPLPPEEERALEEMLRGFLKLLRFMHRNLANGGRAAGGLGGGPYGG